MQEIRKRKIPLTEALMSDPDYILQHVQQGALITPREYSNMRSIQRSNEGRVIDLLDKVMDKGEDTCQRFLTLLQEPEVQDTFPRLKKLCSAAALGTGSTTSTLILSEKFNSKDIPIQETQNTELSEYRMTSLPRGHCLIFNYEHFKNLKEHKGSSEDAEALRQVFDWLGFRVSVLEDQTAGQMRAALRRFSCMDHGDCFVCCVLSHGTEQGVYGQDGELVPIQDILSLFNGASCPSLVDKPKVFFFQACQGTRVQGAVTVQADCIAGGTHPETDTFPVHSHTLPVDSDFLVGVATVQECVSIRNPVSGSWYIQSLCHQLREACPRGEDILTILTRVNQEVSGREGALRSQNGQTPDPRFTLRKRLVFPVPTV
ncbi:caspase-8-like isoform X1 [Conger conger]|uniref:caspase-8-like isoform X1 n=1 Tax=Conger conger TaxID=82655 RepID=UPI002A59AD62|nr:caspase-8-like isoform X1 [Conger conger]XP_061083021.1 caspase-8-like isoform X1 [Conger conger]XP_061083022.1 caspase-8-like isoform X1 [Conger conger]